ncbi:MAG: DinB family protein [Candidatus Sulfotelmatobacter sp.]
MEIKNLDVFLRYFDNVHQRTMRVVRCIPRDQVDWSFRPGKFTLGDLSRHIAAADRYIFAETVQGKPSAYAGCGRELAPLYDDIISFMEELHRQSAEIISRVTDLDQRCTTPDGASLPVWKWLRAMVEHEAHHRGQIYTYLALLEVPTPPLYGMTSEQVAERSAASRASGSKASS